MIIQLLDGTQYDIEDFSLKRLYHHIPSIKVHHNTTSVEGKSGWVFLESQYSERSISVVLLFEATDIYDYYLIRDEVNALLARTEPYYIIFKKEPYKRWLVRIQDNFELPPDPQMEAFTVQFICEKVYAESVATTLEMENNKEWDTDIFGWNNTITWDEDLSYTFTENQFVVKNLGNEAIDPREHELIITIQGNFPNGLILVNATTGEVYVYHKPLTTDDVLVIDGIATFNNGISDFGNTNKKLITLTPGNNYMTILSGTLTSAAFNFRFLYK